MTTVRYIVSDVAESVDFYVSKLGFEVEMQVPAFASLTHDDLTLWLAGPRASASRSMLDGSMPTPGGWSRFVLVVDDLDSVVSKLEAEGVTLLNEIVENQGRKQILCADPSGNVIEFQQPAQESL